MFDYFAGLALKGLNFIHPCSNKPKKGSYYTINFCEKRFIHVNHRIVFRVSETNLFPEHFVFLEEDHFRRCPISERKK